MKEYPWGKGTVRNVRLDQTNDSDYTWTVPAGKIYKIRYLAMQLVCTATVGSRTPRLLVRNSSNEDIIPPVGAAALAASQAGMIRLGPGYTYSTTITFVGRLDTAAFNLNGGVTDSLPEIVLVAGDYIRFYDSAAIDAAADDLYIAVGYVEYDA